MITTKKAKQLSNKKTYIKTIDIALLSMIFTLLIALIIGMWVGTTNYKSKQLLTAQDTMDILADNLRMQFENYITQKADTLKGFTSFPEIYEMDREKQRAFIKGRSQELGFHHLFIMSADGHGFYIETDEVKYQKDEPFFKDVMENEIFVTEPFYGADATTLTVCVSIYNKSNEKVGALCGALELKELQDMFEQNRMIQNGKSFLVNRQGRYIAVENMQEIYEKMSIYNKDNSDFSLVRACFNHKADQQGKIIQEGVEYLSNVSYLQSYNWAIVQCIETDTIFEDIRYIDFWKYGSLLMVACIFLGLIRITIYWHKSERRSETDALTGCRSRASMEKLLKILNKETENDVTIIYFDLNHFKQLNDTYGHDKGDSILCIFSKVLMDVFGESSYVGRIGGDEFIVVLQNALEHDIIQMCNQITLKLQEQSNDLEFGHIVSTAYGYATRKRGSSQSLDDVLTKADEEMYKNKRQTDRRIQT